MGRVSTFRIGREGVTPAEAIATSKFLEARNSRACLGIRWSTIAQESDKVYGKTISNQRVEALNDTPKRCTELSDSVKVTHPGSLRDRTPTLGQATCATLPLGHCGLLPPPQVPSPLWQLHSLGRVRAVISSLPAPGAQRKEACSAFISLGSTLPGSN